ncbi:MAG: colicin V family bacteriocin [Proteobacteria bacterium]|nr:colicin V family bacteriocin [Pseudomonadota bacterium]
MRSLTLNEVETVAGAGYVEDVNIAAATAITAAGISAVSGIVGYGVCGIPATVITLCGGSLASAAAVSTAGFALGAVLGPLALGAGMLKAHPEYVSTLNEKFHHYFG